MESKSSCRTRRAGHGRGSSLTLDGVSTPDMKDPIGLIVALLFTGLGASWILFPQWAYRVVTPEQAARDRKRFKTFGFLLLPLGLILLAIRFFR